MESFVRGSQSGSLFSCCVDVAGTSVSAFCDGCSPLVGAQIAGMPREKPMVAVEVLDSILEFAINGFVKVFDYFGSFRFCSGVVCVDIVQEDRQRLRAVSHLRRSRPIRCVLDHDAGSSGIHLGAAQWLAVAI